MTEVIRNKQLAKILSERSNGSYFTYEKPNALELFQEALELAERYEQVTGKKPNRIQMTQEQLDCLVEYAKEYLSFKQEYEKEKWDVNLILHGMEIIINA